MAKDKKIINTDPQKEYHNTEDISTECMVNLRGPQLATYQLYEAIANNDFQSAQKAIQKGADLNSDNKPCSPENEETPLDAAVYWAGDHNCSEDMIKFLKRNGARSFNPEIDKFIEEADQCLLGKCLRKKKFHH